MSSDIIGAALQALASNDPERISAVLTEDAEWYSPPGNATAVALGVTHHMVGRAEIVRFFTADLPRMFAGGLDLSFRGAHSDGERATAEVRVAGTLADGNLFDCDYCFVFELRDGLIHRVREYVDTARAHRMVFGAEAPGVLPVT